MNKQEVNTIIENYITDLRQALHEPTLDREIENFPIDEDKAFFLLLPLLDEGRRIDGRLKGITLSVGAIQAALDIHDRIDRFGAATPEQQLTVLAGDHFSGIHYRILAETGEFPLIRELSQTIAYINEQKTALQNAARLTAEQLLHRLAIIETACIATFYKELGYGSCRKLAECALTYIRLHRMAETGNANVYNVEEPVIRRALGLLAPVLQAELLRTDRMDAAVADRLYERFGFFSRQAD